jgi:hypothetical protein
MKKLDFNDIDTTTIDNTELLTLLNEVIRKLDVEQLLKISKDSHNEKITDIIDNELLRRLSISKTTL